MRCLELWEGKLLWSWEWLRYLENFATRHFRFQSPCISMYYHYIPIIQGSKVTPFGNFKCGFTFHIMFKDITGDWHVQCPLSLTRISPTQPSATRCWQSLDPGPHPRRTPVVFPMADAPGPWRCNRQVGDKLETVSTHKAPGFRISFGATLDRQNMTKSSFGCSCKVGKLDRKSTHELLGNYLRAIRAWIRLILGVEPGLNWRGSSSYWMAFSPNISKYSTTSGIICAHFPVDCPTKIAWPPNWQVTGRLASKICLCLETS